MADELPGLIAAARRSQMLRLLLLGVLVLILLIPIAMIGGLMAERSATRDEAIREVTGKWGKGQVLTGPALVIPYAHHWTEVGANGQKVVREEIRRVTVLPDALAVKGQLESEVRHRGIFSVPVYRLTLEMEGRFSRPAVADLGIDPRDVSWDRAQLAVGIADARAIQEQAQLRWNGTPISFLPGTADFDLSDTGIRAPLGGRLAAGAADFSFRLVLNGSVGVYFVPFGQETDVTLESNWPDPSFQGNWLPAKRSISERGFQASWSIPFLGRNYPQAWTSKSKMRDTVEASKFGLDLVTPVDEHRMSERSVKYAGLFILLTFGAIWLIEVLGRLRLHAIQYLLVGAAMCVFYLLELSLSEHLGFGLAYALASAAVVGLIAAYGLAMLKTAGRAGAIGALVAALYGYLYVLLNNQDYALLVGSIGLFLMLAAIMYLTRRIDWYDAGKPRP